MTGNLSAQLTSNGSATAGNQYHFIFYIIQHFFGVNLNRFSSQKVFNFYFF